MHLRRRLRHLSVTLNDGNPLDLVSAVVNKDQRLEHYDLALNPLLGFCHLNREKGGRILDP